jgi:hypothetical protein
MHLLSGALNGSDRMNKEFLELLSKPTADVEDVGRICFDLSRNGSYQAAKRGDFPTVRIGRRVKALTAPLPKLLGIET